MLEGLIKAFKGEIRTKQTEQYIKNFEAYSALPRKTRKTLGMLWGYELPPALIKKLKEKFPFNLMSDKEIVICVDEFKKFMAIMVIGRNKKMGVAMTSNVIDEIWHQFILFTLEYEKFSDMLNGKFIHHTPNTAAFSFRPDAIIFFYSTYKEFFGELHPIWLHTIIEDGTYKVNYSKDDKSLLQVLSEKQSGTDAKNKSFAYITKYQLSEKANLSKSSIGSVKDATNTIGKGAYGGILCSGFTTGYTAADGSGVADLGGCGGGCGGCGGCGG